MCNMLADGGGGWHCRRHRHSGKSIHAKWIYGRVSGRGGFLQIMRKVRRMEWVSIVQLVLLAHFFYSVHSGVIYRSLPFMLLRQR